MKRINYPLTVEQLLEQCRKAVDEGNGKKYVLISDDEEGNGYHECYFGIEQAEKTAQTSETPFDLPLVKCVTLG